MNLEEFEKMSKELLSELAHDKSKLRKRILEVPQNEALFSLCEHYDTLDKIILYVDEKLKIRVWLLVFADDYSEGAHNHRWSYSSLVLRGGYRHTIFVPKGNADSPSLGDLSPVLIRHEKAGDFYSMHYSQYHSVVPDPGTVTLSARGPAETDRFRLIDRSANEARWQYGAAKESDEEKAKKKMSKAQFDATFEKLTKLGVI